MEFVHAIRSCAEGVQTATVMELHQSVLLVDAKAEKRHEVLLKAVMDNRMAVQGTIECMNARIDKLADYVTGVVQDKLKQQRYGARRCRWLMMT